MLTLNIIKSVWDSDELSYAPGEFSPDITRRRTYRGLQLVKTVSGELIELDKTNLYILALNSERIEQVQEIKILNFLSQEYPIKMFVESKGGDLWATYDAMSNSSTGKTADSWIVSPTRACYSILTKWIIAHKNK